MAAADAGPMPDTLLARAFEAQGGRAAFDAVRTVREEFKGTKAGVPFSGVKWLGRPDRLRYEVLTEPKLRDAKRCEKGAVVRLQPTRGAEQTGCSRQLRKDRILIEGMES